ncbi:MULTISPECIES: thiamine diphosphokinase [unclassified Neochlamydia]|uniref:thiamine diphosphokinase n=1 Tax=unclassified Neochlamydia TaxID=2643326 RepID=UPI0005A63A21|nr:MULTISPECIES: thiamine diphosphokinase [unclassified Neochlamydia]BBI17625.1 Thiamine pyrophosphokinase [Neochlamydia sp. S13]
MHYPLSPQVAIVANGEISSYSQTKHLLSSFSKIIAVDGGLKHCQKMGVTPCLLIGDLDSLEKEVLEQYADLPLLKYPEDKNESDLELAIHKLLMEKVGSIALFGVLGKRSDHLLYTLYLLSRHPSQLMIESEKETIFCLQGHNRIKTFIGQTISLIPLSPVYGIRTQGLKWELQNADFDKKFMSLSNVCNSNAVEINVLSGDLICFLHKNS